MSFAGNTVAQTFSRWLPTPPFLFPPAAGLDISDTSIKWVIVRQSAGSVRVERYGKLSIPTGVISGGLIADREGLVRVLEELRRILRPVHAVHMSLPEESSYVFPMRVPRDSSYQQMKTMIEFEFENRVPLVLSEALYDFDILDSHATEQEMEIVVTAFPRDVTVQYASVATQAGLTLLSFENELLSAASAVMDGKTKNETTLFIDFGRSRTGIACIRGLIPLFTATISVGSGMMTEDIMTQLGVTEEEAEHIKDTQGVTGGTQSKAYAVLAPIADTLSSEVERYYRLWNSTKDERRRITQAVLVGGGANVHGLAEHIAHRIHVPVVVGNVWGRIADFDAYIPPITKEDSFEYATAIGLALRAIHV